MVSNTTTNLSLFLLSFCISGLSDSRVVGSHRAQQFQRQKVRISASIQHQRRTTDQQRPTGRRLGASHMAEHGRNIAPKKAGTFGEWRMLRLRYYTDLCGPTDARMYCYSSKRVGDGVGCLLLRVPLHAPANHCNTTLTH